MTMRKDLLFGFAMYMYYCLHGLDHKKQKSRALWNLITNSYVLITEHIFVLQYSKVAPNKETGMCKGIPRKRRTDLFLFNKTYIVGFLNSCIFKNV